MNFRTEKEKKNKFSPVIVKLRCQFHGLMPVIDISPSRIGCSRCEELRFNGGRLLSNRRNFYGKHIER